MGIPIYDDPSEWSIIDVALEANPNEWHPANRPTNCLCRCLEGLRDLEEALQHLLTSQARAKRRRRLRAVIVPLHGLCVSIVALLNSLISDQQYASRLPEHGGRDISRLLLFFKQHVPFARGGKLTLLRNKISAHYDVDMTPAEMRVLNLGVELTEVAEWISIALAVVCDTAKLNVFMWSGQGYERDSWMLMCTEPLMTDFEVKEGRVVGINGCYVAKSPKWEIYSAIRRVWELSDQMFERGSRWRIREFFEDPPNQHWSKILRDSDHEN